MSRVARIPVAVPKGVELNQSGGELSVLSEGVAAALASAASIIASGRSAR